MHKCSFLAAVALQLEKMPLGSIEMARSVARRDAAAAVKARFAMALQATASGADNDLGSKLESWKQEAVSTGGNYISLLWTCMLSSTLLLHLARPAWMVRQAAEAAS